MSTQATPDAIARTRTLLWRFRETCLAVTAVKVGLVEKLAGGPAQEAVLAIELGLQPKPLSRFLRALAALGLVVCNAGEARLTDDGRALHELRHFAQLMGEEYLPAWIELDHSLRTGETAFEKVFGMSVWAHREANPHLNEALNRTMLQYQASQIGAILEVYDFSSARLLVDVGGGYGTVVCEILARYPEVHAILFDQPHVVPGMVEQLDAAGMTARCRPVGGSFFESVPAGGDTYVIKHVLHNWDDARCVQILKACREAIQATGHLLIVENIMTDSSAGWTTDGHWNDFALDMHMMAVLCGEVRSLEQFDDLLRASGFERTRVLDAAGLAQIIEAVPVDRQP